MFGLISLIKDSVDLLPRDDEDGWRNTAARRQALESAVQADRFTGIHDDLVAGYGDGPLAGELAAAAAQAHQGYREIARYLREDYAPLAAETDGVGAERYAVAARLSLGADIDLAEACEWGWAELARIEAELAAEADKVSPGVSAAEASALLDRGPPTTRRRARI